MQIEYRESMTEYTFFGQGFAGMIYLISEGSYFIKRITSIISNDSNFDF